MPHPTTRARLGIVLELLLLLAGTLLLTAGSEHTLDLHPIDEGVYLDVGRRLLAGGPLAEQDLAWSPLCAMLLATTDGRLAPAHWAPDVLRLPIALAMAVAMWALLRAALRTPLAVVLALYWIASDAQMIQGHTAHPTTYLLGPALWFGGLALLARGPGSTRYGLPILGLAMIDRGELALPGLLLAALLLARQSAAWRPRGLRITGRAVALVALSTAILLLNLVSPAHRSRAWLTFQQHFGGMTAARGSPDADRVQSYVFADHSGITEQHFPGAHGLLDVVRTNPGAYAEYAAANASELPRLLEAITGHGFDHLGMPHAALPVLGSLLLAGALLVRRPRRRLRRRIARTRFETRAALLAGLGSLATAILLSPRTTILVPLLPLFLTTVGAAACAWFGATGARRLGWLVVGVAMAALWIGPSRFARLPQPQLWLRRNAELAERHLPDDARGSFLGVDAKLIGSYTDRPRLRGRGPRYRALLDTADAAAWWPADDPPTWVAIPLDALETAPGFVLDLATRAGAGGYRLLECSPAWALFAAPGSEATDRDARPWPCAPRDALSAIRSTDATRRWSACLAAGLAAAIDEDLEIELLGALGSPDTPIDARRMAAWACGQLRIDAARPGLVECSEDPDGVLRAVALHSLGRCASARAPLRPNELQTLEAHLDDSLPLAAQAARAALRAHGR